MPRPAAGGETAGHSASKGAPLCGSIDGTPVIHAREDACHTRRVPWWCRLVLPALAHHVRLLRLDGQRHGTHEMAPVYVTGAFA